MTVVSAFPSRCPSALDADDSLKMFAPVNLILNRNDSNYKTTGGQNRRTSVRARSHPHFTLVVMKAVLDGVLGEGRVVRCVHRQYVHVSDLDGGWMLVVGLQTLPHNFLSKNFTKYTKLTRNCQESVRSFHMIYKVRFSIGARKVQLTFHSTAYYLLFPFEN